MPKSTASSQSSAPPNPPSRDYLGLLVQFLDNNFEDIVCVPYEGHERVYHSHIQHQIGLYHESRLHSPRWKRFGSGHGPDANEVAKKLLLKMIDRYEEEKESNVNYMALLKKDIGEIFDGGVSVHVNDRAEGARVLGRRFKVSVELDKGSEEFERCGSQNWVFVEGFGRDNQQAADKALQMLRLKRKNGLLWINEATNSDVDFFKEKDLKALKKAMEKREIMVPSCHKPDPEGMEMKRSNSTLSMETIRKLSPFGSPTTEKNSFIGDSDNTGSPNTISPSRSRVNLLTLLRSGRSFKGDSSGSASPVKKSDRGDRTAESSVKSPAATSSKDKEGSEKERKGKEDEGGREENSRQMSRRREKQRADTQRRTSSPAPKGPGKTLAGSHTHKGKKMTSPKVPPKQGDKHE